MQPWCSLMFPLRDRNAIVFQAKTAGYCKKLLKRQTRPNLHQITDKKRQFAIVPIVTNAWKVVVPRPVHNLDLNKSYANCPASGRRRPPARAEDPQKGNGDYHCGEGVTPAGIERCRNGLGQRRIEHAFGSERQGFDDAPERIDDCGNSAIGGPHQRKPLFDRAYSRLLEVLVGACAGAEPAVIGQIEEPAGPFCPADYGRPGEIAADMAVEPALAFAARYRVAGKNDFVTDQRQKIWCSWRRLIAPLVAGDESAADLRELLQTEPLKQLLKRQVFAEWHQMDLVVDGKDRAVVVDHVNRIVGARDRGMGGGFRRADRAGDQYRFRRQERRDLGERIGFARKEERKRRFRPDEKRHSAQAGRLRAARTTR